MSTKLFSFSIVRYKSFRIGRLRGQNRFNFVTTEQMFLKSGKPIQTQAKIFSEFFYF